MEEYFLRFHQEHSDLFRRRYIPSLWTNFQIEPWFNSQRTEMQRSLDEWIHNNPAEHGYFTVTQYDDGPLLILPKNTLKLGACSGDSPLPLIYDSALEDSEPLISYNKPILCSFVGSMTHSVRQTMAQCLSGQPGFVIAPSSEWSPQVSSDRQDYFIQLTRQSRFALSPRGYGRNSFRFFEAYLLGAIPVYVWDDEMWLPFQDKIDYTKIAVVINVADVLEDPVHVWW